MDLQIVPGVDDVCLHSDYTSPDTTATPIAQMQMTARLPVRGAAACFHDWLECPDTCNRCPSVPPSAVAADEPFLRMVCASSEERYSVGFRRVDGTISVDFEDDGPEPSQPWRDDRSGVLGSAQPVRPGCSFQEVCSRGVVGGEDDDAGAADESQPWEERTTSRLKTLLGLHVLAMRRLETHLSDISTKVSEQESTISCLVDSINELEQQSPGSSIAWWLIVSRDFPESLGSKMTDLQDLVETLTSSITSTRTALERRYEQTSTSKSSGSVAEGKEQLETRDTGCSKKHDEVERFFDSKSSGSVVEGKEKQLIDNFSPVTESLELGKREPKGIHECQIRSERPSTFSPDYTKSTSTSSCTLSATDFKTNALNVPTLRVYSTEVQFRCSPASQDVATQTQEADWLDEEDKASEADNGLHFDELDARISTTLENTDADPSRLLETETTREPPVPVELSGADKPEPCADVGSARTDPLLGIRNSKYLVKSYRREDSLDDRKMKLVVTPLQKKRVKKRESSPQTLAENSKKSHLKTIASDSPAFKSLSTSAQNHQKKKSPKHNSKTEAKEPTPFDSSGQHYFTNISYSPINQVVSKTPSKHSGMGHSTEIPSEQSSFESSVLRSSVNGVTPSQSSTNLSDTSLPEGKLSDPPSCNVLENIPEIERFPQQSFENLPDPENHLSPKSSIDSYTSAISSLADYSTISFDGGNSTVEGSSPETLGSIFKDEPENDALFTQSIEDQSKSEFQIETCSGRPLRENSSYAYPTRNACSQSSAGDAESLPQSKATYEGFKDSEELDEFVSRFPTIFDERMERTFSSKDPEGEATVSGSNEKFLDGGSDIPLKPAVSYADVTRRSRIPLKQPLEIISENAVGGEVSLVSSGMTSISDRKTISPGTDENSESKHPQVTKALTDLLSVESQSKTSPLQSKIPRLIRKRVLSHEFGAESPEKTPTSGRFSSLSSPKKSPQNPESEEPRTGRVYNRKKLESEESPKTARKPPRTPGACAHEAPFSKVSKEHPKVGYKPKPSKAKEVNSSSKALPKNALNSPTAKQDKKRTGHEHCLLAGFVAAKQSPLKPKNPPEILRKSSDSVASTSTPKPCRQGHQDAAIGNDSLQRSKGAAENVRGGKEKKTDLTKKKDCTSRLQKHGRKPCLHDGASQISPESFSDCFTSFEAKSLDKDISQRASDEDLARSDSGNALNAGTSQTSLEDFYRSNASKALDEDVSQRPLIEELPQSGAGRSLESPTVSTPVSVRPKVLRPGTSFQRKKRSSLARCLVKTQKKEDKNQSLINSVSGLTLNFKGISLPGFFGNLKVKVKHASVIGKRVATQVPVAHTEDDDASTKEDDASTKDDDASTKDDDANTKDDDANTKDDDANTKDDDANTKDDDANTEDY